MTLTGAYKSIERLSEDTLKPLDLIFDRGFVTGSNIHFLQKRYRDRNEIEMDINVMRGLLDIIFACAKDGIKLIRRLGKAVPWY